MPVKIILPLPPSVNKAYANVSAYGRRGRKLTSIAQAWKDTAGYAAKIAARTHGWIIPEPDVKIIMQLWAWWPDNRKHDMNNLHKLTCDALEGIIYANDNMVLVRDMDFDIDRKRPRLEMVISRYAEKC